MKPVFLICYYLLVLSGNTFSQFTCSNGLQIQSPVVSKPSNASFVSATCTSLVVQWDGASDQTYEVAASYTTEGQTLALPVTNIYCDNLQHCLANISVTAGTKVNWHVQAKAIVNERVYYSYPLQGERDFLVPDCGQNVAKTPGQQLSETIETSGTAEKHASILNDQLAMYPNPVYDELNMKLNNHYTGTVALTIMDVSGRSVMLLNIKKEQKDYTGQVSVRSLNPGLYFVHIKMQNGNTYIMKFLKN
jgi:hypothetical protein